MMGVCKFFKPEHEFGFITGEDGQDYYVHADDIQEPYLMLRQVRVVFDPCQGARSLRARNVVVVKS